MADFLVAALYKFADLPDFEDLQAPLLAACKQHGVKGTLLLASEGINGTIAGLKADIRSVRDFVLEDPRFEGMSYKESYTKTMPFHRMKVRIKKEIGTFEGAINPKTESFREFPAWVENASLLQNKPKVAMCCTGGIRCEKSTAYLKELGYEEVYHLKGGILKYLETIPEAESMWKGECFVFDARVSVGHGLELGHYDQCYACRRPIDDVDKASQDYVEGVSCPKCIDAMTEDQRERFAERQRQIELSKARGEKHIAAEYDETGRVLKSVKQTDPL